MKKILILSFYLFSISHVFAQNRIDSLKIIPTHITEDSNVIVVCYSFYVSYPCDLKSFTTSIDSFNVDVFAVHNLGFAPATCNSTDTLQIGKYKKGIYELIYHRQTNFDTILDTINFEVFRGTGNTDNIEEDKSNMITIYPNPSSSIFNLELNENQKGSILVFDVLGNTILEQNIDDKRTSINLTHSSKGMFFVQILDERRNLLGMKKLFIK